MAPKGGFLFRQEEERKTIEIINQMEDDYKLNGKERVTIRTVVNKLLTIRNHAIGRQKKRYLENLVEKVLDERAAERAAEAEKALESKPAEKAANGNVEKMQQDTAVKKAVKFRLPDQPDEAAPPVDTAARLSEETTLSSPAFTDGDQTVTDSTAERGDTRNSWQHKKSDSAGRRKRKRRRHESDTDSDGENDRSKTANSGENDRYNGRLLSFAPTQISPSGPRIKDVAGMDDVLTTMLEDVMVPLQLGQVFEQADSQPSSAILLHGPSGCGKTLLANALAAEAGVPFFSVVGAGLIGGVSGDSEANIQKLFDAAIQSAPSVIFIDCVETLVGKPEMGGKAGTMEFRMANILANSIDRLHTETGGGKYVILLAATNKADSITPEIRRRFSSEITLRMPDKTAREQILRTMTRNKRMADDVRLGDVAQMTSGFVGGDLYDVVMAAQKLYIRDILQTKSGLLMAAAPASENGASSPATPTMSELYAQIRAAGLAAAGKVMGETGKTDDDESSPVELAGITSRHFAKAVSSIVPAAKREGFSTVPNTTWAQVGAMYDLRRELETSIIGPIQHPERYASVGLKPECGILLWGPPGCGKTLVAKAVANESKANFISVRGPELVNKFVGEAERAIRELFERARTMTPCIIFFDEMDAIMAKRDTSRSSDGSARIVATLLTELDGLVDRAGLFIIGATNRPDSIDPALKRPGRFGDSIYVGPPSPEDRVTILQTLYRNAIPAEAQRATPEQLAAVALDSRCDGYSGADLAHLLRAAGKASLERDVASLDATARTTNGDSNGVGDGNNSGQETGITEADWERALGIVRPSTDLHALERYKKMN